jgi:hypothetical protein
MIAAFKVDRLARGTDIRLLSLGLPLKIFGAEWRD